MKERERLSERDDDAWARAHCTTLTNQSTTTSKAARHRTPLTQASRPAQARDNTVPASAATPYVQVLIFTLPAHTLRYHYLANTTSYPHTSSSLRSLRSLRSHQHSAAKCSLGRSPWGTSRAPSVTPSTSDHTNHCSVTLALAHHTVTAPPRWHTGAGCERRSLEAYGEPRESLTQAVSDDRGVERECPREQLREFQGELRPRLCESPREPLCGPLQGAAIGCWG